MMSRRRLQISTVSLVGLLAALLIAGTYGCPVHFVSNYDQVTDQTATELQTKVDTFLVKMQAAAGTPDGDYNHNKAFYDDMDGALQALLSRAEAIPQNKFTVEQVTALQKSMMDLRKLHEERGSNGLTATFVAPAKSALDGNFKAIIALEGAKRRGKE